MKIEGIEWKRVTKQETDSLADDEFGIWTTNNEHHYFKKPQKFPIRFRIDDENDIYVQDDGLMDFCKDDGTILIILPQEIPLLVKAVEKAKEVACSNK